MLKITYFAEVLKGIAKPVMQHLLGSKKALYCKASVPTAMLIKKCRFQRLSYCVGWNRHTPTGAGAYQSFELAVILQQPPPHLSNLT
jgi:hypothetical protein